MKKIIISFGFCIFVEVYNFRDLFFEICYKKIGYSIFFNNWFGIIYYSKGVRLKENIRC